MNNEARTSKQDDALFTGLLGVVSLQTATF